MHQDDKPLPRPSSITANGPETPVWSRRTMTALLIRRQRGRSSEPGHEEARARPGGVSTPSPCVARVDEKTGAFNCWLCLRSRWREIALASSQVNRDNLTYGRKPLTL